MDKDKVVFAMVIVLISFFFCLIYLTKENDISGDQLKSWFSKTIERFMRLGISIMKTSKNTARVSPGRSCQFDIASQRRIWIFGILKTPVVLKSVTLE